MPNNWTGPTWSLFLSLSDNNYVTPTCPFPPVPPPLESSKDFDYFVSKITRFIFLMSF